MSADRFDGVSRTKGILMIRAEPFTVPVDGFIEIDAHPGGIRDIEVRKVHMDVEVRADGDFIITCTDDLIFVQLVDDLLEGRPVFFVRIDCSRRSAGREDEHGGQDSGEIPFYIWKFHLLPFLSNRKRRISYVRCAWLIL